MKLDTTKLGLVKYKFSSFQLVINNKTKHTVPNSLLLGMSIIEDYDNFIFPYFEITVAVPNAIYRQMTKNNRKIKAVFTLQKGKSKEALSVDTTKKITFKNALKGTYYVFMDDTTPDLTEAEQKQIEKSDNQYGQLTTVRLLLYNYSFYKKYDLVVNTVLENVSLAEVLTYLLNTCGITKALLSPPSNYKKKTQFILTPIPLCDQLDRICNEYKIHNKGTLVFFGVDRLYLIERQAKCTGYVTNEYKITYVVTSSNFQGTRQTGGCYTSSSGKYNVVNLADIVFKNTTEYTSKTTGTNAVYVNSDGKITKTNKKTTKRTKVVVQKNSNHASYLKQAVKESKRVLTATFKDVDFNMFRPNKQFIVTLDGTGYKKYNGKYRLSKVAHTFTKEGDYYTISTVAELKG